MIRHAEVSHDVQAAGNDDGLRHLPDQLVGRRWPHRPPSFLDDATVAAISSTIESARAGTVMFANVVEGLVALDEPDFRFLIVRVGQRRCPFADVAYDRETLQNRDEQH